MALMRAGRRFAQRGASMLEMMGVLAVSLLLIGASVSLYSEWSDMQSDKATSDWLSAWQSAGTRYMNDQAAALIASNGGSFTMAQIQAASTGYFPPGFSATSPYGQTASLTVTLNAGQPQGLICAGGGLSLSDRSRKRIANNVGIAGGWSPTASPAVIKGNAWGPVNLTTYGVASGACQVVAAQFVSAAATVDDYLHRHDDGNVAHHQMNQQIDMNGNPINNVTDVHTKAGNQGMTGYGGGEHVLFSTDYGISLQTNYLERMKVWNDGHISATNYLSLPAGNGLSIGSGWFYGDTGNLALRTAANGGTVYIQGTSTGGGAANLYVAGNGSFTGNTSAWDSYTNGTIRMENSSSGVMWDAYGKGWLMTDGYWMRCWGDCGIYTGGQVQAGSIQSNSTITAAGRITTGENLHIQGYANAGWGCDASNGALFARATDGTNQPLMCKSGIWTTLGEQNSQFYLIAANYAANYTGYNNSGHTMWAIISSSAASGCSTNDYGVNIYVNGNLVGENIDFNGLYAKAKTVTVPVPVGGSYQVNIYKYQCNVMSTIWEYR